MNSSDGKLNLMRITSLVDSTLITILIAILSISCILALLLVIPATIQYVVTLMSSQTRVTEEDDANNGEINNMKLYERSLYRYRIMFNISVFLIIMGSSMPLLIHLINVSHQSGVHLKAEETTYEFVISLWGVCQLLALLDIGSRLFFAWMVAIPPFIVCLFFFLKISKPDLTFRIILYLSVVAFVVAYLSPVPLVVSFWKRKPYDNGSYYICVSHKRNIFYARLLLFELIFCHLLPVLVIVPSVIYTWRKMKFATMDLFFESLIFAAANFPFIIIEIVEQVSILHAYDFSGSFHFANFYMILMTIYHMSYTCMFLVAPIQSMLHDGDGCNDNKLEISNVYQVLINRDTIRRSLERRFTSLKR